jgi:hypothetical protein
MSHKRYPLYLEVVDHEEFADVEQTESDGLVKVAGSEKAFLNLKASNGLKIRAEIPHGVLNEILALMFPMDFYPEGSAITTDDRGAVVGVS